MKKFFIILLFMGLVSVINAQTYGSFSTNAFIDDSWSNWLNFKAGGLSLYGNYHSIAIHESNLHPSKFFFKVTINGFQRPSKKEIKEHYKKGLWYEYDGTVEYYRTDEYPTAKAQLEEVQCFLINAELGHKKNKPAVKQISPARIRIQPYKKTPQCYNIFFDGVGFAIDLKNVTFTNW